MYTYVPAGLIGSQVAWSLKDFLSTFLGGTFFINYIENIVYVELLADEIRLLKKFVCIARGNACNVEVVVLTIWGGLIAATIV